MRTRLRGRAPEIGSGRPAAALARPPRRSTPRQRQATVGQPVTRKVDSAGSISFAGATYRVGGAHRARQVQVSIVGDVVEISSGGEVIRTHPIHHDRSREHGAFANPGGRARRVNAAKPNPRPGGTQVPKPKWNTGTGT